MVDLEAEPLQLFGIALPVLGDLDVEVKIDPLAEQRLDPLAGGGADLTKARSTFADDDCLLAGPFDEDVDPDVEQRRDLRTARLCGISSSSPSRAASRTSSAIMMISGSSVSTPSGYSIGEDGR